LPRSRYLSHFTRNSQECGVPRRGPPDRSVLPGPAGPNPAGRPRDARDRRAGEMPALVRGAVCCYRDLSAVTRRDSL